jgi:predicted MFS family arabinose efflux permease
LLGRIAGLFSMVAGTVSVLGAVLGGALGGWIGVRETLLLTVAGMAAAPLFVLFSPLRRLKDIPLKSTEPEPI